MLQQNLDSSKTKIIPPTNSALLSYLSPNLFPILVPTIDKIKVIIQLNLQPTPN